MQSVSLSAFQKVASSGGLDRALIFNRSAAGRAAVTFGTKSLVKANGGAVACNREVLKLFREALSQRYGVFGEHAFDMALGVNLSEGKALKVRDIRNVLETLDHNRRSAARTKMIESRFLAEVDRQVESHPLTVKYGLGAEVKARILARFENPAFEGERRGLIGLPSQAGIETLVSCMIFGHVSDIRAERGGILPEAVRNEEARNAPGGDDIVGLRNLEKRFSGNETSVEDRIRSGGLSSGMRVDSHGEKLVLERLKTNGVEPGFIARRDWTEEQTREMMTEGTFLDSAARTVLAKLRVTWPANDPAALEQLKIRHFTEIRDEIIAMRNGFKDIEGSSIRKLSDRYIVKLDYNESDRSMTVLSRGSSGVLHLPKRIKTDKGAMFHRFRVTTADKASCGAVREALANDLTRALGIPGQELEIVRGEYSDGHPKLMLQAKFAEGYKDFDGNFLVDGRVQMPDGGQAEDLGKYKAAFLLLADRDAVGSHGQNKGLVNGRFFAIDPGHSLEGDGSYLQVNDDFTFVDKKLLDVNKGKRFCNFSVFDDSNRSEKLRGWMNVRAQRDMLTAVFSRYLAAFAVRPGDGDAEIKLKLDIHREILSMRIEFEESYRKLDAVFAPQVGLHRAVVDHFGKDRGVSVANRVIDAVENFERATSPVRKTSSNGKVRLRHLEVIPEKRTKWSATFEAGVARFSTAARLTDAQLAKLREFLGPADFFVAAAPHGGVQIEVPAERMEDFLAVFTEANVSRFFHPGL